MNDAKNRSFGGSTSYVDPKAAGETLPKRRADAPTRSMGGALVSIDYCKPGSRRIYQRCSKCHGEHRVTTDNSIILPRDAQPDEALCNVMAANNILGFVCSGCLEPLMKHILSWFPDSIPFPHVDEHRMLMDTPRCECGNALRYTRDQRTVVCDRCDVVDA